MRSKLFMFIFVASLLIKPLGAQMFATGASVPSSDDETAIAEKNIANQGPPPDASIYQAQTEANNQINALQNYIDSTRSQRDALQRLEAKFPKQLSDAQSAAEKCEDPKQILSMVNPYNSGIFISDSNDPATDTLNEILRRSSSDSGIKLLCQQVKTAEFSTQLQTAVTTLLSSQKQRLADQQKRAERLQTAWQHRLDSILTQAKSNVGKKSSTEDLVSSLPWIVIILCAFSIGMFCCLRLFGSAVQMELVTSGQVIQFPTVMVLLVVIVSLGLVHILTESSLSALLGGLAGYVLSQGVGKAALRASQEKQLSAVTITPSSLVFGDEKIGALSPPQIVSVTNQGTSSCNLVFSLTGDFSQTNDLKGSLAPHSSVSISVVFEPERQGQARGELTIKEGTTSTVVALLGKGI